MVMTTKQIETLNNWKRSEPELTLADELTSEFKLGDVLAAAEASGTTLTNDQIAALDGAASPASGNVFATANDIVANNTTYGNGTLANASTTVVSDAAVKTGDEIHVTAKDTACAAIFAGAAGVFVDTIVDGVSFTVNHPAAAGTETFSYSMGQ